MSLTPHDLERPSLDDELSRGLQKLDGQSLRRSLRPAAGGGRLVKRDGESLLNLAGNDYLALAEHPALIDASVQATQQHGVGSGASRLVTGHREVHAQCEQAFADFKHAEAALLFSTGYMANLGVLAALAGPDDLICQDKLNHASLIDAARMCGATVRTYPHLDANKLAKLLERGADARRRFIVTDSVFSMDGDCADLPTFCDLAERFDATLIIDEAHATGVLGAQGTGLAEAQGVADRVPITISTASKALGSLGGIVTASRPVIDTLINHARSFIYTTAPPPAQAAAITAALQVIRDEPQRRARLQSISQTLRDRLTANGWPNLQTSQPTPILPLITGTNDAALALADHLQTQGILAVAIRPPTVAPGSARVRLSLRSDLTDDDVTHVIDAVGKKL